MKRTMIVSLFVVAIALLAAAPAYADGPKGRGEPGRGEPGTIYVTSQDLYYDTYTVVDTLPMEGRFQQLENGTTEFGPGDPGYLGGRWWIDNNGDDVMDSEDTYFLCPLLPPGDSEP